MDRTYYQYFPPSANMVPDAPDGKRRKEAEESGDGGDSREGFHEKAATDAIRNDGPADEKIELITFHHTMQLVQEKVERAVPTGKSISLDKEAARMSKFLTTIFDVQDAPGGERGAQVELPQIDACVLEVIVDYCNHHKTATDIPPIPAPLEDGRLGSGVLKWDRDFADEISARKGHGPFGFFFRVLKAADFLGIQPLVTLLCARLAAILTCTLPADLYRDFQLSGNKIHQLLTMNSGIAPAKKDAAPEDSSAPQDAAEELPAVQDENAAEGVAPVQDAAAGDAAADDDSSEDDGIDGDHEEDDLGNGLSDAAADDDEPAGMNFRLSEQTEDELLDGLDNQLTPQLSRDASREIPHLVKNWKMYDQWKARRARGSAACEEPGDAEDGFKIFCWMLKRFSLRGLSFPKMRAWLSILTPSELNYVDAEEGSFLHVAAKEGFAPVVEWLLECEHFRERNAVIHSRRAHEPPQEFEKKHRYPSRFRYLMERPGGLRETALHSAVGIGRGGSEWAAALAMMNDARFARENVNGVSAWVSREDPRRQPSDSERLEGNGNLPGSHVSIPQDTLGHALIGRLEYIQDLPDNPEFVALVRSVFLHDAFDPLPLVQAMVCSYYLEEEPNDPLEGPLPLPLFHSIVSAYLPAETLTELGRKLILQAGAGFGSKTANLWWAYLRKKFCETTGRSYFDPTNIKRHGLQERFAVDLRLHDSADIVLCILRFCEFQTNTSVACEVVPFLPDYLQKAIVVDSPWWRPYDATDPQAVTKFWDERLERLNVRLMYE